MKVRIPTPLRSYTDGCDEVEASGRTLGALLKDLDKQFPGFRFRIIDEHDRVRQHVRLFVGRDETEDLGRSLAAADVVHVICALSGG